MENEKCKIELDSPTNTYRSGQTINGKISLICNKGGKRIRGIYFKISGYGKCGWYTLMRKQDTSVSSSPGTGYLSHNKETNDLSVQYSGQEEYLNSIVYLVGSKNGPSFDIPEGTTTYPFSYHLSQTLPSTFKGTYGKIKYKIEFIIDKPWKFDEKYEVPLIIYKSLDPNYNPEATMPQQKQITRNIGYFGSGPISLHIFSPRLSYAPGDKLPLQVIVSNNSSTPVDKVKFTLRKIIDYNSLTPTKSVKQEVEKVLKKEAGGVDKKDEQKYEHNLTIPELPATDNVASKIINIRYEIKVEAKISGLYKNLIETIPIMIATIPLRGYSTDDANVSSVSQPVGMPALPPYPLSPPMSSSPPTPAPPGFIASPAYRASPLPNPRLSVISSTTPTAPPFDFVSVSPNSTRSSICSSHMDAPPSYDEVFGSPSSMSSSFRSNKSATSHSTLHGEADLAYSD